ncbi:MAG: (4Fe-4S)-binding protein, partial [Candidatus Bipolaricaulia bacterium]
VHDLERVLGVARHFRTKPFICINKYDLNEAVTEQIERFAQEQGLEVIGRIPYDEAVTEAMVQGKSVIEYSDHQVAQEIRRMWTELSKALGLEEVRQG